MSDRIPVILDCDPGHDDMVALVLALGSDRLDVKAITNVAGNKAMEKVNRNTLNILNWCGVEKEVAAGAVRPLVRPYNRTDTDGCHGLTGLDGFDFPADNPRIVITVVIDGPTYYAERWIAKRDARGKVMRYPNGTMMMEKKEGAIINISSVSGIAGNIGQSAYSGSKAAVIGMTKTVAKELAARGITCNAIAPGFVATEMTDKLSDEVKDSIDSVVPLKRMAQPEDIANAAVFLASDKASYITGEVLKVDGGLYI